MYDTRIKQLKQLKMFLSFFVVQLDVVPHFAGMNKVHVMLKKDLRHAIEQPCNSCFLLWW